MSKKNTLKRKLLTKTSEFLEHSTLHGVYYFYSSANKWVYIFWVIVIASSIGLCGFLGNMIWDKFIIDPTFTVVETTHYPTGKISFPAVTLCDTQMVYGPNTNDIKQILHLRGFEQLEINDFFRSVTDVKRKDYEVRPHVTKMHAVLDSLGYSYNDLLDMFKKPCEILIEECVWRAKTINCSQMFRSVFTFVGYCCQFDLAYFRMNAAPNTNFVAGADITEALDITVNTESMDSNGLSERGYVLLYVFDKDNEITLLDSPITVTAATYFDVTLTVWLIDSSADVKALSLPVRKCFLHSDSSSVATSYQSCMMNTLMKKVVEHCQCLPFNLEYSALNVENFPPCSWSRLICVYNSLETAQGNIRDVVSSNECYQNCDYVQYETEVEYLKQERTLRAQELNSRLTVHFEENSCMKYRREVLYTWDQMLANLGGIFGLCLGGSIISVIEIAWFLMDLLFTCLVSFKRKSVSPRNLQTYNEAFTVYKKENNIRPLKPKGDVSPRFKFIH